MPLVMCRILMGRSTQHYPERSQGVTLVELSCGADWWKFQASPTSLDRDTVVAGTGLRQEFPRVWARRLGRRAIGSGVLGVGRGLRCASLPAACGHMSPPWPGLGFLSLPDHGLRTRGYCISLPCGGSRSARNAGGFRGWRWARVLVGVCLGVPSDESVGSDQ